MSDRDKGARSYDHLLLARLRHPSFWHPPLSSQRAFMLKIRPLIGVVAVLALLVLPASPLLAQGVTTGSLTGTITDNAGAPVEGAQVRVRNALTGYNIGATTRASGLYVIQGIEPNQNYRITVRRIGYAPITRD